MTQCHIGYYYDNWVAYWSLKSRAIELGEFAVCPSLPNTFVDYVNYIRKNVIYIYIYTYELHLVIVSLIH